jgi:hypothetical protein
VQVRVRITRVAGEMCPVLSAGEVGTLDAGLPLTIGWISGHSTVTVSRKPLAPQMLTQDHSSVRFKIHFR